MYRYVIWVFCILTIKLKWNEKFAISAVMNPSETKSIQISKAGGIGVSCEFIGIQ